MSEEGFRSELVTISDIASVMEMKKDELADYALSRFGITLNKSEKIKLLRLKIVNSIRDKLKHESKDVNTPEQDIPEQAPVVSTGRVEFLWNPKNRRIFEWTELLAKRGELVECYIVDKKGNRL